MSKERKDVIEKDKWNVEALYPSFEEWQKEYNSFGSLEKPPFFPEVAKYRGHLNESPEKVLEALETILKLDQKLSRLYTYAHLRFDEDIANDEHKKAFNQILSTLTHFGHEISWFEPELLALDEKKQNEYLQSTVLTPYRFYLEKIIHLKPHTLSAEKEELLALSSQALYASHKAFSAINDADFVFPNVKDSDDLEHPLTHATFALSLRSQDRTLRKNAFLAYHGTYQNYQNTLCELLNGQIQSHVFNSRARHYPSCLDAALFPKNIETQVYHSLIEAVHADIPCLYEYIDLRKQILGLDDIHLYDMYVPLTKDLDIKMPYEEAVNLIIESVAPLGSEYQDILHKGLVHDRWVDRFENKNKRSGAYSSGCYDSMPYILMNYKNILRDVFTLAHEAGHSMHSYYTHKNQPYQYGSYPIFLAEVASTFNEDLLMQLMIKRAKSKNEKIFLLNQKIEDLRGTLFRQTMFAEFELFIHECAEKNIPLTPKSLKEKYRALNRLYFGNNVQLDPESDIEWARIPHFYYNFYVYQYATGISAALSLSQIVTNGGEKERDAYLNFLKSGSSRYPIETLQLAGVDMLSPEPVKMTIKKFSALVTELKKTINS
ncbi:MAG: oligoendopeptidase F [Chlamydia sp. 32-24]|nr:MAG: oligoendopeptidase F [Chlamydia sp. 32-24]